jgi:hypothetical protein
LLVYHDFLWKLNYANGLYIRASDQETTYRAFVGFGNNSNLIKSILRRRYWWVLVDKTEGCNFAWTQLKNNGIFREAQVSSQTDPSRLYYNSAELVDNTKTESITRLQDGHERIFNSVDLLNWNHHMKKHRRGEVTLSDKTYKLRV